MLTFVEKKWLKVKENLGELVVKNKKNEKKTLFQKN